jgi:cellulose 1,4-beta-cellobiosidase
VAQYPADASLLQKAANLPVAFWIDRMAKIPEITAALDGAKAQQATTGKPTLTAFVIYDLPNRDCAAGASNGEISCAGDASCAQGLSTYQHNYIDPIVNIMKQYPNQPIVAIVEPDSLPNLATNIGMPNCAAAQTAYKQGIAYAVQQLSTMSNVHIYIDAAHGGWLGWPANLQSIASIFNEVLVMAGGANKVRGFVTNVSGYQALGSTTSTEDPCNLASQYNFAINEVKYVDLLSQALATVGITDKGFIIDTSRNGVPNTRTSCSNWCNINNAGLGMRQLLQEVLVLATPFLDVSIINPLSVIPAVANA